ncbi:MAG: hypothetical protein ACRETX_17630, partial [Steroidobacteraceae bacterium]
MNRESLNSLSAALRAAALLVLFTVQGEAFAAEACAGQSYCVETRSFAAVITNFRTSKQSTQRIVTATVRFQNKTDRPLTLGYVKTSGVAMDDEGNRYVVWGPSSVRGIGEIAGSAFDSKFTLQPQERSDARFELVWNETPQTVAGTRFELDLAVREISEVAVDQFRLGQEHSLHFERLGG